MLGFAAAHIVNEGPGCRKAFSEAYKTAIVSHKLGIVAETSEFLRGERSSVLGPVLPGIIVAEVTEVHIQVLDRTVLDVSDHKLFHRISSK